MFYQRVEGNQPLMAVALHNGHDLRSEVNQIVALDDAGRFREEDPHTGSLTSIAENRLVVYRSRFEVDLNRPRESAVYREPADAWGLSLWKKPLTEKIVSRSLGEYDAFYSEVHRICSRLEKSFGHFVVFDLHTYNHRRNGPDQPAADPEGNPEINVGTGTMTNRHIWAFLVDGFIKDLQAFDYFGRNLDVRENVKFRGGHLSRYIHETFPESGCVLAVEFKKFFMDEWTGTADAMQLKALREALQSTLPGIMHELIKIGAAC